MLTSGYWQNLTTRDFSAVDAERTIAVLPVAAVEQHGPHLPLETDALINDGIIKATLERLPRSPAVLFLPAQSVGTSAEHADFPGTLSVDAETLLRVWLDIGASVARAGVRKLVIFNTHGGQKALVDLAALRLRIAHDLLVVRANYFSFGAPEGLFPAAEWQHGLHGGEIETSLVLHLAPNLVRREALENFTGLSTELARENDLFGAEKPVGFGWKAQDLHPAGVCGNAAAADAKRGALYLEHLAKRFAVLLAEIADTPLGVISNSRL